VLALKNARRGRIKEYAEKHKGVKYYEGKSVWDVIREQSIKVDLAFPSAHEKRLIAITGLLKNGCYCNQKAQNAIHDGCD
jgi:glutamate dehydrogenase (NADP+)